MFIKKIGNNINLMPIKYMATEYEVSILLNIGSNIEYGIERGYIHLFEHIIILEDMMKYVSDTVYLAEGYTELDHMQIKFLCKNEEEVIRLLKYINKVTEQIEIPDRVIRKAQEIVLDEMKTNKIRNIENKSKIQFLSEGKFDLPIGRRENIEQLNKTKFLGFINNYLNCVEIGLIVFSNIDNEKILNWCKNVFDKRKMLNKEMTLVEPKLRYLSNKIITFKNIQKPDKKIICLAIEWYKDLKNIILQQLIEVILQDFMKEKNFTIGYKIITKENMYLTLTFNNSKDIDYIMRNFVLSKEVYYKGINILKSQFFEMEKIGLNKWCILDELYKKFLYNMPIIDVMNIPSVLKIIDQIVYEDVKAYFISLSMCNCKIIEYVGV